MKKKRDRKGYCIKCGVFRNVLHRDHIIPKWNGGLDDASNIQHLCANCHEDKTIAENQSIEYRACRSLQNKKTWEEGRNKGSTGHKGHLYALSEKSEEVRTKIGLTVKEGHRLRREQEALLSVEERAVLSQKRSDIRRADHKRRKERKTAFLQNEVTESEPVH